MNIEILKPVLLLYLLDLAPEQETLVVEVKHLRDLHNHAAQRVIEDLLISPDEAIDHSLVVQTEFNEDLQSHVLSRMHVFDFLLKVSI